MIQQDLVTWVQANASISAVIGTRFYPGILPQNATLEAIVYSSSSQIPAVTMQEVGGYNEAVFTLSSMAESYGEAKQLAKIVRAQLHGYQGTMGSTTIHAAFQISEDDGYDPETLCFRVDQEYGFHFAES